MIEKIKLNRSSSENQNFNNNGINRNTKLKKYVFRDRLYRKRFLVPNAVTLGSMFCGFLTIIYSATGRFEKATIAIALSILLDGLDGRVARQLNATSKFGGEFDSFADLVSFGIAPAIMIYFWCFQAQQRADEFGVFVSFIYVVCAASRLARFNIAPENLKTFTGLPSPAAAGAIASVVNFKPYPISPDLMLITIATLSLITLGFLMVSTVSYLSIKNLKIERFKTKSQILLASIIGLLWYNSGVGFLVFTFAYALSGPILSLRKT